MSLLGGDKLQGSLSAHVQITDAAVFQGDPRAGHDNDARLRHVRVSPFFWLGSQSSGGRSKHSQRMFDWVQCGNGLAREEIGQGYCMWQVGSPLQMFAWVDKCAGPSCQSCAVAMNKRIRNMA